MNEETLIEKAAQGMERVNLDEGGLFVVQMKVEVSVEALKRITKALNTVLQRHCEEAEVLVLPVSVEPVSIVTEMNKLGWFKREENGE